MKTIFAAELLLAIGMVLFSVSMFISGLIVRRLLKLIRKQGIWIMQILGGALVLAGAIVHIVKLAVYFPALARSNPYDLLPQIATTMQVGAVESLMVLFAGFFAIISSLIYFGWTNR